MRCGLMAFRAPFLKRLRLEGSGDRARWTTLAAEGTLFDLPAERMRKVDVEFVPGEYRYLRVTWDDTNSGRVARLPRRVAASPHGARRGSSLAIPRRTSTCRSSGAPASRAAAGIACGFRLRGLPIVAIELEVGGGHVFRQATVSETSFRVRERRADAAGHRHAEPRACGTASTRRITADPISPPTEAEIQLRDRRWQQSAARDRSRLGTDSRNCRGSTSRVRAAR